jgi:hypothetical protein
MGLFDNFSLSGTAGKFFGSLASTVITGYIFNKISKSLTPASTLNDRATTSTTTDYGNLIQLPPSQNQKIPVLYGRSTAAGIITDAVQTNNGKTMTYVITICEKTGDLLSSGAPSTFTYNNVYWNDQRIVFKSDTITADYTVDRLGTVDRNIDGLVRIRLFDGTNNSTAYNYVPGWSSTDTMNNLIFAIVEIDYNRDRGITSLPNITFNITNSMTQPGDVIYDYMTNSRYGAGIPSGDIYTS